MNICGGTKPVGAECRVFNKTLTYHYETGDTFSLACGIKGLKCESNPKNPCEDYEVRYRCSANKGMLYSSDISYDQSKMSNCFCCIKEVA